MDSTYIRFSWVYVAMYGPITPGTAACLPLLENQILDVTTRYQARHWASKANELSKPYVI